MQQALPVKPNIFNPNGFTLIELVVVIIILAVIAIIAAPKFINFATEARINALSQLQSSVKAANTLVYARTQMPSISTRSVPGRDDLTDIDLEGDGSFNTRLINGYLDNTDIEKWIVSMDDWEIQYRGAPETYIGYDLNDDGEVRDDNCYFLYTQASSEANPPTYQVSTSGC
ncbi:MULTISPECIES: prepilin-type N-terminal cleavage/methylation domain-containing protein [unclassified Shewanella]|uniref:prepilin-type N-terminal cleavage/methylation domain-containing protein n=1 Tax=unclassified Shewanella TaxID=196818 RepID=UPI000C83839B|nr:MULTISPECIES: prepilin-type N-terminal cleavage/methylation domain-containing protein [unclassified Shewanella]MDO6638908.1 prepilin-type N-terminal cleavage/methylation domain-containing protein [Shewanella sp. 5_MG-2023]MDO6676933.1 prepilin-type N-terminal cleavage/methylation domain-containing protein [Shewanella sp. 4_MG-2023]MDO6773981.1 prepilin-type N-terminal cleavage/methylation domain-containing protein [Shewanella sp. 3_MG-2023]